MPLVRILWLDERERPTHSGPYQRLRRVPSAHIWWQFNDWLDNLSWNFFYLKNWLLLKYFNWPALLFSCGAQLTTDQPYLILSTFGGLLFLHGLMKYYRIFFISDNKLRQPYLDSVTVMWQVTNVHNPRVRWVPGCLYPTWDGQARRSGPLSRTQRR